MMDTFLVNALLFSGLFQGIRSVRIHWELSFKGWFKWTKNVWQATGQRKPASIWVVILGILSLLPMCPCRAEPWSVSTIAGTGEAGFSGDGGLATKARLNNPFGIVRGPDHAYYFCEYDGQRIRRIDAQGIISTIAGSGRRGGAGDGGPAIDAEFNQPHEIRFDPSGNLWIADMQNHRIRRIDMRSGIISTVVGTGTPGFSGDGGMADHAMLKQPHSIQFDSEGRLYLCDIGNHRVRRVDLSNRIISTIAGDGTTGSTLDGTIFSKTSFHGPRSLDFDGRGNLWLALREGNQVYELDMKSGKAHHRIGTGQKGFTGNGGLAVTATLSGPKGIAIGSDGSVYLVDTESHSIRRYSAAHGILDVVIGTGERGNGPNGNPLECRLARPHGIWVDPDGSLLIGDSENHQIRRLTRN